MTVAPNPEIEAIGPAERRPGLEQRWKKLSTRNKEQKAWKRIS